MSGHTEIKWLPEPEEHDFPAAESYLGLLFDKQSIEKHLINLKKCKMSQFKAKDIFRASGLSPLGVSNYHVEKDKKRYLQGSLFLLCCW